MRSNDVYKRAFNQCLQRVAATPIGGDLGPETGIAADLGVSRTTVRTILDGLETRGILGRNGRDKWVLRHPRAHDRYPEIETESVRSLVERRFMEMVLNHDIRPGQQVNGLDLARQFSVSPSAVREYLTEFSGNGLLERRPNASWIFRGFDGAFAEELSRVRELFELDAAQRFADLGGDDPVWARLDALEDEHRALLANPEHPFVAFSRLDEAFHETITSVTRNRFVDQFQGLVRFVFHYHYQWRKDDEQARNLAAIKEHLTYIAALKSRDPERIRVAAEAHLAAARKNLFASIQRGREEESRTRPA